jgi:phosphoglycolate phosphatase
LADVTVPAGSERSGIQRPEIARPEIERPSLVVFDFDGTLADSAPWFARELNGVARRFRFRQTTREDLEAMRRVDARTVMRELGVARWKLPLIARHMRRLMTRDIGEIGLFPGIAAMLRGLREAGLRLAIVSSNSSENVRLVLGTELTAFVDHFACGTSVFGKTAKFRGVLEHFGVAPAAAIAIGDEVRDIDAAEAIGIVAGAVTWGYASRDALRARKPAILFDEVGAILPYLLAERLVR